MGLKNLTPRTQARRLRVVYGCLEDLLVVLVSSHTAQVQPNAADFVRLLGGANQLEESFARVECAVGVVVGKSPVVRPLVAHLAKFACKRLARAADGLVKGIPTGLEAGGDVAFGQNPELHLRVEGVVRLR